MALIRTAVRVAIAMAFAHFIHWLIPHTLQSLHLTQTSVTLLTLAALAFLVITHHRQDGQLLTQTQEEMILIGAFGAFWFALLMAWRGMQQGGVQSGLAPPGAAQRGRYSGKAGGRGPGYTRNPCSGDAVYCVVEEWEWY